MHKKHSIIRIIAIVMMGAFILLACSDITIFAKPSETTEDCIVPTIDNMETADQGQMFYLLISGKESYQEYRQKITEIILPEVLQNVLRPNDTVIVSWMEADAGSTLDDSVPFMGTVASLPTPVIEIEATPQFIPTYTPDPGLIPGPKKDRVEEEMKKIENENGQTLIKYHCQTAAPNSQAQQSAIDKVKLNQQEKVNEVILGVRKTIDGGTGYHVGAQEALGLATKIIQSTCGENSIYTDCTILVFSNLDDADSLKSSGFDFSSINLGVVLLNCTFWIDECGAAKNEISSQFHDHKSICFISAQGTVPTLSDYLRSKKCNN